MDRTSLLDSEYIGSLILAARRAIDARKAGPQTVGTFNVNGYTTSLGDPAWSGQVSTIPSLYETRVFRLTATADHQTDLFARVIHRLDVGTDGNWYRPSNFLEDQENSDPTWLVQLFDEVQFGLNRNQRSWRVVVTGEVGVDFFLRFWVVANDTVTTSLVSVAG